MKRIPIVAALALAVVLFAVTKLATVTRADYGPCFHSCSSAQVYLDELHRNCIDSVNPFLCNPQFGGYCGSGSDGHGGYMYQCSWGGWQCSSGGGWGGSGEINPDNPSCQ